MINPAKQAKEIADAADQISTSIDKHGFPTVLALVLVAVCIFVSVLFVRHWSWEQEQWRSARDKQINELTEAVKIERNFVRDELTRIITQNIEATQKHTQAVEKLTDEIKRK